MSELTFCGVSPDESAVILKYPHRGICGHLPIDRLPVDLRTAIDIGAHVGTVALMLANRGTTVYCFEPHPISFLALLQNCCDNALTDRMRCYNLAVTDEGGKWVELRTFPGQTGQTGLLYNDRFPVSGKSFSIHINEALAVVDGPIDYLKIDVEGMEHSLMSAISESGWARIRFLDLEVHSLADPIYCTPPPSQPVHELIARHGFVELPDTEGCVWFNSNGGVL